MATLPPINLASNPYSAASAGADFFGDDGASTGAITFGATGGASWVSDLMRDLVVGVAVALLAKWAWGKIK